jgi:DNA-binding NarL/FixJ family response regulator
MSKSVFPESGAIPEQRLLVVHRFPALRHGIRRLVEEHFPNIEVGEAGSSDEADHLLRNEEWDAVEMGLVPDDRDGIEMLKRIKRLRPSLPVLVYTRHPEERSALRCFEAGAAGYVTQDRPAGEFLQALRKVMAGRRHISPAAAESLLGTMQRPASHNRLSNRELEVLQLIAAGMTVGEIAKKLSLSSRTISTYRARLLEKLALRTNAQLMRYALDHALVD